MATILSFSKEHVVFDIKKPDAGRIINRQEESVVEQWQDLPTILKALGVDDRPTSIWYNIWPLSSLIVLLAVSVAWTGFLGYEVLELAMFLY
jgi:hypothetical protein